MWNQGYKTPPPIMKYKLGQKNLKFNFFKLFKNSALEGCLINEPSHSVRVIRDLNKKCQNICIDLFYNVFFNFLKDLQ